MKKKPKQIRNKLKKKKKLTAAQRRRLQNDILQIQALAVAGIGLIEQWAPASNLDEKEEVNLGAMGAALLASYLSNQSGLRAKRAAIAMALRAAYVYGRFQSTSQLQEKP